jgi:hypothetical protein
LGRAWEGAPVVRTVAVETGAGSIETTLAAPYDAGERRKARRKKR